MGVGHDADTDWSNRTTALGGLGISAWTLAGWHYRSSGVSYTDVVDAAICGNSHDTNGRHVALRFNNRFSAGTASDPYLVIADNNGATTFDSTTTRGDGYVDASPPFDTWVFYYIRSGASGGTVEAAWTADDGTTWHTQTHTNTTEGSVTAAQVLIGRGSVGTEQGSRGRYAYWQAWGSDIGQASARALLNVSSATGSEWAFWRLANNSDTADTSGNSRTLTFNGTLTSEGDPTIPGGGAVPVFMRHYRNRRAA